MSKKIQKRYKLTKNTKTFYGIKVYQIQAIVSFGSVKKGDLGGWVESEKNLAQEGTGWIFEDGLSIRDGVIRGGVIRGGEIRRGTKTTIDVFCALSINCYDLTMTDNHISWGCKTLEISEWFSLTKKDFIAFGNGTTEKH